MTDALGEIPSRDALTVCLPLCALLRFLGMAIVAISSNQGGPKTLTLIKVSLPSDVNIQGFLIRVLDAFGLEACEYQGYPFDSLTDCPRNFAPPTPPTPVASADFASAEELVRRLRAPPNDPNAGPAPPPVGSAPAMAAGAASTAPAPVQPASRAAASPGRLAVKQEEGDEDLFGGNVVDLDD